MSGVNLFLFFFFLFCLLPPPSLLPPPLLPVLVSYAGVEPRTLPLPGKPLPFSSFCFEMGSHRVA